MKLLRLKIELVPSTSWGNNLRNALTKAEWDIIRKQTYRESGYRCSICGVASMIHCHEVWHYNDETYIQTLEKLQCLCNLCHNVKHYGNTEILAADGKLSIDSVVEHFCKVNVCTVEDFQAHRDYSFGVWAMRSNKQWVVGFGEYSGLIKAQERG